MYTILKELTETKKGKPTSDEVSIGKLDKKSKKLIPNDNYFEIFKDRRFLLAQLPAHSATISEPEKVSIHEIKNCAISVAMLEVAKQTLIRACSINLTYSI
jgi:hypothetical protein